MADHLQEIPEAFCWTRFGTEAGETVKEILRRKERERTENGGLFFWGIGNSVAPGLVALLRKHPRPEVLFSPIKGRPRPVDREPAIRSIWRAGTDLAGERFDLPPAATVTSGGIAAGRGRTHFALVCHSATPLSIASGAEVLDFGSLRNFVSGNPIGASQVTAVVRALKTEAASSLRYSVAMRAELAPPYFIRLTEAADSDRRLAGVI